MNTIDDKLITPDEDIIDLKVLVHHLWQDRILIVAILVIAILVTSIYTFLIQEPTYETTTSILFKLPAPIKTEAGETHYQTSYGQYVFPSQTVEDYFRFAKSDDLFAAIQALGTYDLSNEALKSSITVKTNKDSKLIELVVTQPDPAIALSLNQDLTRLFIENIRIVFKKNALDSFISQVNTNLTVTKDQLADLEAVYAAQSELLQSMAPTYTLKKMLVSDPLAAAAYAEANQVDLESLGETVVEEEYLNDSYFQLETTLTDTQNQLIELKQDLVTLEKQQANLQQELDNYQQKIGTPSQAELLGGELDVLNSSLIVISQPSLPQNPVAPDRMMQLAIGTMIGLMLGLGASLVRRWWHES